jgi:hypothetical protein
MGIRLALVMAVLSIPVATVGKEPPRALSDAVHGYILEHITAVESAETFRFALPDLNGDGHPDAIVLMSGRAWCGSGGCTMLVFRGVRNRFDFVSRSTVTNPPIRISKRTVRGWRTLIVGTGGIGNVLLSVDSGLRYPPNPSVEPKAWQDDVNSAEIAIDIADNGHP